MALATEFGGSYAASHFTSLSNFEAVVGLLSGGLHGEPFQARTLAPLQIRSGRREAVIRRSREKYASRKGAVEGKIHRWLRRSA
jgi:hypothetical protein